MRPSLEHLTAALIVDGYNAFAEGVWWMAAVGQEGYASWSLPLLLLLPLMPRPGRCRRCQSSPLLCYFGLIDALSGSGDGVVMDQLQVLAMCRRCCLLMSSPALELGSLIASGMIAYLKALEDQI